MITIVTMLWRPPAAHPPYGPQHVNALLSGLNMHLCVPFRMVCATEDPAGLDPRIDVVPMTRELVAQSNRRYLKLLLFRRDAAHIFCSERLLYLDLDVVPVDDIAPLLARQEDFVIWRDPTARRPGCEHSHRYNSSVILMNAGCRPAVYETFEGATTPDLVRHGPLVGSDQAWIGLTLGPDEATFGPEDGILGLRQDIAPGERWPDGSRIIVAHSRPKPWDLELSHPLRLEYERHRMRAAA